VKGVLALGRPSAPSFAPCSVHEILDAALRVARPQGRQRGVQVDAELGAGNDRVSGDAEQLEAAFLNLLLNGLDAAEGEGGRVLVTTEDPPGGSGAGPPESSTHKARSGRSILIRITDSGPGIDPAARDQIFRPFYSSKSAGSGFGLPLALRTIEEHRGRLELEEGAGSLGGAAFRVELPLLGDKTGTVNGSESP
jgi:signal transduction histidine kinase